MLFLHFWVVYQLFTVGSLIPDKFRDELPTPGIKPLSAKGAFPVPPFKRRTEWIQAARGARFARFPESVSKVSPKSVPRLCLGGFRL